MSEEPGSPTPPLPTSIWVVAWASVASQVVALAHRGVKTDGEVGIVVSVVLGALLVGYVSAGVVRARTVRLVLAWVVLMLALVAELVGLLTVEEAGEAVPVVLALATTVVALAGLGAFRRTEWYAWQRRRPPAHEGASIGGLLALAVLVGALGGLTVPADDGVDLQVQVGGR